MNLKIQKMKFYFKTECVPLISPEIKDSISVLSSPKKSPTHNNKSKGPNLLLILLTPAKSSASFPFAEPTVKLQEKKYIKIRSKRNNNSIDCFFYLHFDCGHDRTNL